MKLLLDQNLSPRLCDRLRDVWPEVVHVRAVGLAAADDSAVWAYARQHGFTIVSKDGDAIAAALAVDGPGAHGGAGRLGAVDHGSVRLQSGSR